MNHKNLNYYMITNKLKNNNNIIYKTGVFQWLNVFNGNLKHIRSIISEINIKKIDIIHILLSNETISLHNIIKNLKPNTKIIISFDYNKEELTKFYTIDKLYNNLKNADLIFGTNYFAVSILEEILKKNIYEIPHPVNYEWINSINKPDKKNYISIVWDKNIKNIEEITKIFKNTELIPRIIKNNNYNKIPEIAKTYFKEIIPYTDYENYCKLLAESKIVFCPNNSPIYYDYIINCAILGTPVIGSEKIESIQRCFPYTCIKSHNKSSINEIIKLLLSDIDFYNLVIRAAKKKANYYNWKNSKDRLLNKIFYNENNQNINYNNENYIDSDITFYLQVYNDYELAKWCLSNVRLHYPESRIIVISDGDNDERYKNFISKFNIEYKLGKRLFTVNNGGLMLKRMFETFLEKPSKYLISIDTDTELHRRFKYLPESLYFGRYALKQNNALQGGFLGFKINAVKKIINSKLLESKELLDYKNTWAVNKYLINIAEKNLNIDKFEGLISKDFILGYCFKKLDISAEEFHEVYSEWRIPYENKDLEFAVTHPCKIKYFKDIYLR